MFCEMVSDVIWHSVLDLISPLNQVKWARENYHHHIGSPYCLRLASADVNGKIIVWDVAAGVAQCEIQEHAKPIQGESPALRSLQMHALVFSSLHLIAIVISSLTLGGT